MTEKDKTGAAVLEQEDGQVSKSRDAPGSGRSYGDGDEGSEEGRVGSVGEGLAALRRLRGARASRLWEGRSRQTGQRVKGPGGDACLACSRNS